MFILTYECPKCNEVWFQKWECIVDDTCPNCGQRNIHPIETQDTVTKERKII